MWVARDRVGNLQLFYESNYKPTREKDYWEGHITSMGEEEDMVYISDKLFPELKWEDEPIEVNLVEVNPKHKMTCPHCYQMIEYTSKDIKTSYDCQPASSLPDDGEDYITCPNCGKYIDL